MAYMGKRFEYFSTNCWTGSGKRNSIMRSEYLLRYRLLAISLSNNHHSSSFAFHEANAYVLDYNVCAIQQSDKAKY